MKIVKWGLVAAITAVLLVSAGTFVYINFIEGDPPDRLTFGDAVEQRQQVTTSIPGQTSTTTVPANGATIWRASPSSSLVGYRVGENLFGQNTEAVGRTNQITGTLAANGTTVSAVDLVVDMDSISSDQDRRDDQFRGRIMDTSSFPTATFKLAEPITLPSLPTGTPMNVKATGDLTLRGVTKRLTVDLEVRTSGSELEVNGVIPITFADWNIPNPSFGGVSTDDHGELELLVVFSKAAS